MFDTAEETHGDGIGITNGKKVFTLCLTYREILILLKKINVFVYERLGPRHYAPTNGRRGDFATSRYFWWRRNDALLQGYNQRAKHDSS